MLIKGRVSMIFLTNNVLIIIYDLREVCGSACSAETLLVFGMFLTIDLWVVSM